MLKAALLEKFKTGNATSIVAVANNNSLLSPEVITLLKNSYENGSYKRVRVVCLAADFYVTLLLKDVLANRAGGESGYDPMSNEACFIFNEPSFLDWAILYQKAVKETLQYSDQFMFTYLCAAVAGELRHAPGKVGLSATHTKGLSAFGITGGAISRSATQFKFLGTIKDKNLEEYLNLAIVVFNKYSWGGSYGGPKWGDIAKTGLMRLTNELDAVSFVDRVYDLKHNGGPVFDKNKAVDNSYVQNILDAKLSASCDADWTPWLKFCSAPVRQCLTSGKTIGLWSGIDPVEKEVIPAVYDGNKSYSYDASPDNYKNKKKSANEMNKPSVPDYPLVQDVTPCPSGKHHE